MYSGTTLTPLSGRVLGTHQKINRLARGSLRQLLGDRLVFPSNKLLLHFEGVNGPDAIKRKSPARDEPWHYISPFDESDKRLEGIIRVHYQELVRALGHDDEIRAAFEAAWLAHAIVDGLTPAHHFPYEEKLAELRGGQGRESRTTVRQKLIMPGETRRKQVSNNWKMWGPKGLLASHGFFEWGVATIIAPLSIKRVQPQLKHIAELRALGVPGLFRLKAKEIAALHVYGAYQKHGWTPGLARIVGRKILPVIVQTVTLAWYAASVEAGIAQEVNV